MRITRRLTIIHGAQADASAGQPAVDDRIMSVLGRRPALDPTGNAEHGELVRVLADGAAAEDLREDITRAEDDLARHPSPRLCTGGIVVTFFFEVMGSILVARVLPVEPIERLAYGVALAFTLIAITAATAHRAAAKAPVEGTLGVRIVAVAQRSMLTVVVLVAYTLLIFAVAAVRIQTAIEDDVPLFAAVAEAVIMIALSAGPPWVTEWLVRKRRPGAAIHEQVKLFRKRLRGALRVRATARAKVDGLARRSTAWDSEAAELRALYNVHYRLAAAKLAATPPIGGVAALVLPDGPPPTPIAPGPRSRRRKGDGE